MLQRVTLFCSLLLAGLLLSFLATHPVFGQQYRAERTAYVKAWAGLSDYAGELGGGLFDLDKFREGASTPYAVIGELGYRAKNAGVGLGYQFGNYPLVEPPGSDLGTIRHTVHLSFRYMPWAVTRRLAPYADAGLNATFGGDAGGLSPSFGIGIDVAIDDRITAYLESRFHMVFDDGAADGTAEDAPAFDVLSQLPGFGLTFSFGSSGTPPRVLALSVPDSTTTGTETTMAGTVNEGEATEPLSYSWRFGDGSSGSGATTSYAYRAPGTYAVIFTASNSAGTVSDTAEVVVTSPVRPARITTINATPSPAEAGTPVEFTSNVRGTAPVDYTWSFGEADTTASSASASYVFDKPDTYTVRLSVSNATGEDMRTLDLVVDPALPPICTTINELNAAFFGRNSSTLTDEARSALMENLDILSQCTNLAVVIEGFAAPGERNSSSLSDDRARAVSAFYRNNGIVAGRISTRAVGEPSGTTTKRGGDRQYRRADSIPQR